MLGGTRYSGANGPANVLMSAGDSFTFSADYSVNAGGFTICGTTETLSFPPPPSPSPSPTAPPPMPPWAPMTAGVAWTVVSGETYCEITNGGSCVTDGIGSHGNSESCVVESAVAQYALATYFSTESYFDYVMFGTTRYSGTAGPVYVPMAAGDTFEWLADSSVFNGGFTICGFVSAQYPPSPPISSPPSPSPPPPSPGECADAPNGDTGFTMGGSPATCAQLSAYCNVAPNAMRVQSACPVTCGVCSPALPPGLPSPPPSLPSSPPTSPSSPPVPTPPPPSPPVPSKPPPAPLAPPGATNVQVVTFEATVTGDPTTFDADAYKANVAVLTAVPVSQISVTIVARRSLLASRKLQTSFNVVTEIVAETAEVATVVEAAIVSEPDLSTALGVTVSDVTTSVATVTVFSPPSSPPSPPPSPSPPPPSPLPNPPPPSPPDVDTTTAAQAATPSSDSSDALLAVAVVIIVIAVLFVVLIALCLMKRKKTAGSSTTQSVKASPVDVSTVSASNAADVEMVSEETKL